MKSIRQQLKTGAVLIVLTLLCTACVSTQSVVDRFGQQWGGRKFDEFVVRYGAPYRKFELSNGGVAYVWNSGTSSFAMPATATTNIYGNTAYTQVSGGGNIEMFCEVQFVTDQSGTIIQILMRDTWGFWATSRCHEVLE